MQSVFIPDLPACAKAPTIYVSTDKQAQEAGCAWGLLVAHDSKGGDFWVLTSLGVRYYGVYSEHVFLTREDPRWAAVHATWQVGLAKLAEVQRTHLSALLEREAVRQRALAEEQRQLAETKR